jgi:hypothetical protein
VIGVRSQESGGNASMSENKFHHRDTELTEGRVFLLVCPGKDGQTRISSPSAR